MGGREGRVRKLKQRLPLNFIAFITLITRVLNHVAVYVRKTIKIDEGGQLQNHQRSTLQLWPEITINVAQA